MASAVAISGAGSGRRRWGVAAGASGGAPKPLVKGPPPQYDHRVLKQRSRELVGRQHPELLPLVEQGALVVLERPDTYIERREDGYQEPQTIFLIGTAHVSQRSAEDVHRVAAAVQPDAVVVELCRSRQAVMYPVAAQQQQELQTAAGEAGAGSPGAALMSAGAGSSSDEAEQPRSSSSSTGTSSSSSSSSNSTSGGKGSNPLSLSGGGGLLPDFQRSLELGGASALMLRLVLGRLSAGMSGGLGVVGGAEFVAARQEAEARGAQLVLGDRPIEITLQRAWEALTWRQRGQLAAELAGGAMSAQQGGLDAAAIERLKDDDAISLLFNQLGRDYPQLVGPLVHERDLYLAWSLKRSKAVNGARTVVGVVGRGHLRGVCYALTHDAAGAHLRFRDLVGGKNVKAERRQQRVAAAGRFALETALFGALWYAWTALQPQQL